MKKILLGLMAFAFLSLGANGSSVEAKGLFPTWHHHSAANGLASHTRPVGHLEAYVVNPVGIPVAYEDLGYGTVTNLGTDSMANDSQWAAPSGAGISTLTLEHFCATGTGSTASAATDLTLQTGDGISPATGTYTIVGTPNAAAEKITCTINYTGTEAVTEWGLFNSATLTATTGTPWTAGTATTGTATGTPYTASSTTVQGEQQFVFEDTTLTCYGLATANTNAQITVFGWYNVGATTTCNSGGHTFPQSTDGLAIKALMFDHLVFMAINVINGDSIQWVFTLSLPSGS